MKKKNKQDLTLINLRAIKKRLAEIEKKLKRVENFEKALQGLIYATTKRS